MIPEWMLLMQMTKEEREVYFENSRILREIDAAHRKVMRTEHSYVTR